MKEIGFAVVGCGAIGAVHGEAICALPGAKLRAVFDKDPGRAQTLAEKLGCEAYSDYDALLAREDIDAVSVCVPSGLHRDVVVPAARAGKHVICEKPLDTSLDRALEMERVCRENGVRLFPVVQNRFNPDICLLRDAVREGKLGKLYWGSAHVILYRDDAYYTSGGWRGSPTLDGGVLLNQGIHFIDLMVSLLGKPVSVMGKCASRREGFEAEDVSVGCVTFESGAIGTIEGTTDAAPGLYSELCIYAEKGSVIFRNDRLLLVTVPDVPELSKRVDETALYTKEQTAKVTPEGHLRQYTDILAAIREDREAMVTAADAIETLRVILALKESSGTGREVKL